ncbi:MAG: CHASE2 domain-containing protein, partial [Pseudomonadota bacterium]
GAVFIAIDDASLDRFGPWPWPRTRLADLVETANASGAAAVAFDAPVTGLDPLSPENAGRIWLERRPDAGLAAKLAETPRHDAVFAKVLKAAPSLLSLEATPNAAAAEAPPPRTPVTVQEGRLQDLALPQKGAAEAPPSILGAAASDIAVRTLTPDRDGVLRRAPTVWIVDRAVRPSLALGAARLALGAPKAVIDVEADRFWVSSRAASGVTLGDRRSPTLADASLRLHAPKSTAPRTISAATLLQSPGEAARSLQGRVAIIGLDNAASPRLATARGRLAPGAIHALFTEQLLIGGGPARPALSRPAEAAAALAIGLIAAFAAARAPLSYVLAGAGGLAVAAFAGSWFSFSQFSLLLDPWPIAIAGPLGALSFAGAAFGRRLLDHDAVHTRFRHHLPEEAIARLAETQDGAALNGALRPLTILSCAVKMPETAMETYAEQPAALSKTVGAISEYVRQRILDAGGAVSTTASGHITGFWNAPLESAEHIRDACGCALALIEGLDAVNADIEEAAEMRRAPFAPAHLEIGIASGPCFIGRSGKRSRASYAPFGRAVEIASGLRQRASAYGPAIIVDESAYQSVHHRFAFIEIDLLRFSEEERANRIYALLGNPFIKASPRFRTVDQAQRSLLNDYRAGDWDAALARIEEGRDVRGANAELFDLYAARIARYRAGGPDQSWTGEEPALF